MSKVSVTEKDALRDKSTEIEVREVKGDRVEIVWKQSAKRFGNKRATGTLNFCLMSKEEYAAWKASLP